MAFKYPGNALSISCTLLVAAFLFAMQASCKKAIEKKKENIVLDAMTNGRWYVEQYKQDTTDISSRFSGYEFQFYREGNIDGIKDSTVVSTGTWTSDISNYTIQASFPATADSTLKLLNHTWKLSDSYLDYVVAETSTAGGMDTLRLRKKP